MLKVGDKVRCVESIGYLEKDEIYTVTGVDDEYIAVDEGESEWYPRRFEKINEEKQVRRTFKLLKDLPDIKKDALFQEACDDGDQEYRMITPESVRYPEARRSVGWDAAGTNMALDRDSVENQPKFFVEVFKVSPEYMTKEELEQFEAFKKPTKITKKGKKA